MTYNELIQLIATDETRTLELKKTTGELVAGMHSLCAMLNSDGGHVVFGIAPTSLRVLGQNVTDNTRKEIGREIRKIEPAVNMAVDYVPLPDADDKFVIVLHADKERFVETPYVYDGKPYYKLESTTVQMPQQMYDNMLRRRDADRYHWDAQICETHTIADLDEELIRRVVRNGINNGRIHASAAGDTVEQLLDRFELLKDGKLINAAVALFAKKANEYPQIELALGCFRGTSKNIFVDGKFAKGNLFTMLDAGITFLMNNLKIGGEVVGLLREEKLELPIMAMREALINALCHRQFERTLANVELAIYDDRVEMTNPGCLPTEIPVEKIKEPHRSYPRNKAIAQVLYQTAYLERWGTGVARILEICKEYGVPEPEWSATDYDVTVTFRRQAEQSSADGEKNDENCTKDCIKELTDRQRVMLDIIANDCTITAQKIAQKIAQKGYAAGQRTIMTELSTLQTLGYLTREGGRKDGRWVVIVQ